MRAEQHFGSRLVEYERNMAERTWQEVGANRAEVTSALEAVAANEPMTQAHQRSVDSFAIELLSSFQLAERCDLLDPSLTS